VSARDLGVDEPDPPRLEPPKALMTLRRSRMELRLLVHSIDSRRTGPIRQNHLRLFRDHQLVADMALPTNDFALYFPHPYRWI
jgi:hypothetical protein